MQSLDSSVSAEGCKLDSWLGKMVFSFYFLSTRTILRLSNHIYPKTSSVDLRLYFKEIMFSLLFCQTPKQSLLPSVEYSSLCHVIREVSCFDAE